MIIKHEILVAADTYASQNRDLGDVRKSTVMLTDLLEVTEQHMRTYMNGKNKIPPDKCKLLEQYGARLWILRPDIWEEQ